MMHTRLNQGHIGCKFTPLRHTGANLHGLHHYAQARKQRNQHRDLRGMGRERGSRLCVSAGLNYPHMPTRLRRQIQELKYSAQLQLEKGGRFLAKLPGLSQLVHLWSVLLEQLEPFLAAMRERRAQARQRYLQAVDKYHDFCLVEVKRKYRWEAHTARDREAWQRFLSWFINRFAVLYTLVIWEILAPCGLLWTLLLPILCGLGSIEEGDSLLAWYCFIVLAFLPLKHPIVFPLRLMKLRFI